MPEEPDIIFTMPDQFRADSLGCRDAGFIDTPLIASLADRGVSYSSGYTPHPLCVSRPASVVKRGDREIEYR
jgi:arylsulfatase A-like enzyme